MSDVYRVVNAAVTTGGVTGHGLLVVHTRLNLESGVASLEIWNGETILENQDVSIPDSTSNAWRSGFREALQCSRSTRFDYTLQHDTTGTYFGWSLTNTEDNESNASVALTTSPAHLSAGRVKAFHDALPCLCCDVSVPVESKSCEQDLLQAEKAITSHQNMSSAHVAEITRIIAACTRLLNQRTAFIETLQDQVERGGMANMEDLKQEADAYAQDTANESEDEDFGPLDLDSPGGSPSPAPDATSPGVSAPPHDAPPTPEDDVPAAEPFIPEPEPPAPVMSEKLKGKFGKKGRKKEPSSATAAPDLGTVPMEASDTVQGTVANPVAMKTVEVHQEGAVSVDAQTEGNATDTVSMPVPPVVVETTTRRQRKRRGPVDPAFE